MSRVKTLRAAASTLLNSSLALSVFALPISTFAQSTKSDELPTQLEEIVVTAQKRTESVQEIPKAVEVLSDIALARAGVTNLQDLKLISPSIQGTANSGSPPAIRGISSFAFSIGVQAQTGVVLDDVPQPTFSTLADELSDVERVEVLPGPQSTLSGRNAAGGLINIVTRKPTDIVKANLTAEMTDDHQKRVAGYITGPLSDMFGFSLSGFFNDWDGPLRNIVTNNRLGGFDRAGGRGKLLFKPTDEFSATLTAYYVRNKAPTVALAGAYPYVHLADNTSSFFFSPNLNSISQGLAGPYNVHLYSETEGQRRSEDKGATLHLDFDTSLGTISSISNASKSETETTNPLGARPVFGFVVDVNQAYDVDYKTQEFRLTSPKGNGRFDYLLGLIYSDTEVVEPYERTVIAPVNWDRTVDMRSTAFYGRGTYAILPATFLTTGVRFQHDSQSYDWVFNGLNQPPPSTGSNTYNFAAGELSLRQELANDLSVYLTYANAQTGRAYDLEDSVSATTTAGLSPLDSERVQSAELGVKSQWLNRRLTLNASVFDQRYRNYQIQSAYQLTPTSLPTIRLLSIGRVETRGIEVNSSFAVTPDWTLNFAATLLDAKIRDYPGAACYTGQTVPTSCVATPGTQGFQGNLAGTTMPGASKFKGVLSTAYTLRMPSLAVDGIFNAFYRYQSSTHYDVLNDPASDQNGFGIVNIAAGVQGHDKKYSVQFFVNNLFDKKNYAALAQDTVVFSTTPNASPAAVYGTYGRDWHRYAGVRLNVGF